MPAGEWFGQVGLPAAFPPAQPLASAVHRAGGVRQGKKLPALPAYARQSLLDFLARNRERAIAEWERAVRAIPAAALLEPDELRDHMPALIDRLRELIEERRTTRVKEQADLHAMERFQEGFNLEQVAWEYSAMRSTLLRLNAEEGALLSPVALVLLNDAIDQAVVRAVAKFHRARVRTLEALDRIAQEGLLAEPTPLDALLHRLLGVIQDAVRLVDTTVVFLVEWDRLVLRAAVGLEEEIVNQFSLAVGEGFAGTVAWTKRPLFTASAETDPRVRNPLLRMKGVKALYGVPLVYGDELIGVAKMGSRTANDFGPEDRQLLRSTAERAAAFIAQRREAEDRELVLHVLGHDLRSPLSTIALGASALETREALSPEGRANVERVRSATKRVAHIIDDLTDYTRTRAAGTVQLDVEELDLGELAAQIARETQPKSGHEIRVERFGDATGKWDRSRLLRAIANLLNNAVAYGAPSAPVVLGVKEENGWVVLSVHNEGEPIAADLLPHVFEAFRRGRKGAGSGLGLYIVQEITRAHGGSVEVESSAEHGTTFRLRLPRR